MTKAELEKENTRLKGIVESVGDACKSAEIKIESLQLTVTSKAAKVKELDERNAIQSRTILNLNKQVEDLTGKESQDEEFTVEQAIEIVQLRDKNKRLESLLVHANSYINLLNAIIGVDVEADKPGVVSESQEIKQHRNHIEALKKTVADREATIINLHSTVEHLRIQMGYSQKPNIEESGLSYDLVELMTTRDKVRKLEKKIKGLEIALRQERDGSNEWRKRHDILETQVEVLKECLRVLDKQTFEERVEESLGLSPIDGPKDEENKPESWIDDLPTLRGLVFSGNVKIAELKKQLAIAMDLPLSTQAEISRLSEELEEEKREHEATMRKFRNRHQVVESLTARIRLFRTGLTATKSRDDLEARNTKTEALTA